MRASHPSLIFLLGLAPAAFLSSCALPFRTAECEPNPAQALLVQINAVRSREGVPPVWPNIRLASAADAHARSIAEGGASGHFGADGSDPLSRIRDVGYLPVAFGENIATGTAAPSLVIEAWLRSPAHREVLLDPSVDEVGLGGVLDRDHPIWVADFGAGRESAQTRCHPWGAR